MLQNFLKCCFSLLLIVSFVGCSSNQPDYEEVNKGYGFIQKEGYPEVRLSAIGLFDEDDTPGINVSIDIVYGSLIYKVTEEEKYLAKVNLSLQVTNRETGRLVYNKNYNLEVENPDESVLRNVEAFNFDQRILVGAGSYDVVTRVTDLNSKKEMATQAQVTIPDQNENIPNLTNVILKSKGPGQEEFITVSSYHVSNAEDSLKFVFQVTNNIEGKRVEVETELIEIESDTMPARPMSFNNVTQSSIIYKGINYRDQEVIQRNRRVVTQRGSILVEFAMPNLKRGNYRFSVAVKDSAGDPIYKARDFGIRSPNYPAVKNVYELAEPLVYLMSGKEFKKLKAIQSPDSLKKAIDYFWLTNVGRKNKAKNVLSTYYERVEQANKLFGDYKEGWKTDMGMVYILFGPPWYVDNDLRFMVWSYTYNMNDPELNFVFQRIRLAQKYYPKTNYMLDRSRNYYSIEYEQIQLWRTGLILSNL